MSDFDVKSNFGPMYSMRFLEHLLGCPREILRHVAQNTQHLYFPFEIPKKSGSGVRKINIPQEPLRSVQARIKQTIFANLAFPRVIVGSVSGRSIRDHAEKHIGKKIVITLDIENFFQNVTSKKVLKVFLNTFGCSQRLAALLTDITTHEGHLPQGASTSPTLANLAILPLIKDIVSQVEGTCKSAALSVWCDDVVISGDDEIQNFIGTVTSLAKVHGFRINPAKINVFKNGSRQSFAGVVVNEKISYGSTRVEALIRRILKMQDIEGCERRLKSLAYHIRFLDRSQGSKALAAIERLRH